VLLEVFQIIGEGANFQSERRFPSKDAHNDQQPSKIERILL